MGALPRETQAGMKALRQETKADIAKVEAGVEALRQETGADIAALKDDLIKWMFRVVFGGMVAVTDRFAAIVKLT